MFSHISLCCSHSESHCVYLNSISLLAFSYHNHREDMKSLQYLKNCIKESMRLFPPVPIVGRTLDQDTKIDGHLMPKGTPVYCGIHAIHHRPDIWDNPEVSLLWLGNVWHCLLQSLFSSLTEVCKLC